MSATFINVTATGTKQVTKLLRNITKSGQNLEPALQEIGEYLLESHQERFKLEVSPSGELWAPLIPRTIKRKKGDKILSDSGTLRDTLAYQLAGDSLLFGSNLEYAATHQFGREESGIPAREFLGIGTAPWNDNDEIVEILQSHIKDHIKT